MLTLQIENYKCFRDAQPVSLNDMTVIAGQNSIGKSSLMQSILLLYHAARRKDGDTIFVNDEAYGLELGTASELPNLDSRSSTFSIGIYDESDDFQQASFSVPDEDSLWSSLQFETSSGGKGIEALNRLEFYYLSSERVGPRISTPMGNLDFRNTGCHGQYTAQVLGEKGGRIKIDPSRMFPGSTNPNLEAQTNLWLDSMIPGAQVTAVNQPNTLQQQVVMRRGNDNLKATNVGFGISYILPIIVTCLVAKRGSFVLIDTPEAHLHPSAQTIMGKFLGLMAMTGLKIVIETHSDHTIDGLKLYASEVPENRDRITINFLSYAEEGNPSVTEICIDKEFRYDHYPRGFMDQAIMDFHTQRRILNGK